MPGRREAMGQEAIVARDVPTMFFIGVTTGQSAIMRVFPTWADQLGHPEVAIEGLDIALHADPARYRQAVAQIKHDPLSLGALVTTHKIDLYDAAGDMFDYLDPYARICGEVSCISKRDGHLRGHAKDPISAGLSLDAILGQGYFGRCGGHVLCFGAGGAAAAIALHLLSKPAKADRPERLIVVNRSPGRLERLQGMVDRQRGDIHFEYICNQDAERNDETMASLPPGSMVINATGMGKDRPGSPVTAAGLFPPNGVAWELNYRGTLDFLHQARRQSAERAVRVEDGWLYFLHGWTQVIAEVLHMEIDQELLADLARTAESIRLG